MIILNVFDPAQYEIFTYGNHFSEGNVPLRSLESWAKLTGAEWTFNLAFFNFDTAANRKAGCAGRTLQYVHSPAVGDIGYNALDPAPTPVLELPGGSKFCGWHLAVLNNAVQKGLNTMAFRARNMNGITTDGRYIHVTTSKLTEHQVATQVINLIRRDYKTGVKWLFVEDAGGSTQEYSAISRLNYTPEGFRNVASVICVKRKEPFTFTRTLSRGKNGEDTKILQQALGGIEIDGIFGYGTQNRLKEAQRALKLVADGYAGPLTYRAMGFNFK